MKLLFSVLWIQFTNFADWGGNLNAKKEAMDFLFKHTLRCKSKVTTALIPKYQIKCKGTEEFFFNSMLSIINSWQC